ncbi:MAG: addiction module toxin RelE [Azospirillum sp.]|nr:addiction module toxin RelE [Azospirillum sp.]
MSTRPITVSETTAFRRSATAVLGEDEIAALIDTIARHPTAGAVIEGTGGVRKLRWQRPGMGKRGGARVIYYYHDDTLPVLLLLAYAKGAADDLSADQKRRIAGLVSDFVEQRRR